MEEKTKTPIHNLILRLTTESNEIIDRSKTPHSPVYETWVSNNASSFKLNGLLRSHVYVKDCIKISGPEPTPEDYESLASGIISSLIDYDPSSCDICAGPMSLMCDKCK